MILVLALSPSLDVTYELDDIRRGSVNRIRSVTRVPGGKALNAARVASQCGAEVRVVVPLGGFTGAWIEDALREKGIAATVVPVRGTTRTCTAMVAADGATSSTDFYEPSSPIEVADWAAIEQATTGLIAAASPSWLVVSGSLPPGVEPGQVAALLDRARSAGVRIVVDSSGTGLRSLVGSADLVKVNRSEASELLGRDLGPADAARAIRAAGGCDAIVTDGVLPGAAVVAGAELVVRPPRRAGRFPAGSGDAFLGGLVAALEARRTAQDALECAADAAERNAAVAGQGILADTR